MNKTINLCLPIKLVKVIRTDIQHILNYVDLDDEDKEIRKNIIDSINEILPLEDVLVCEYCGKNKLTMTTNDGTIPPMVVCEYCGKFQKNSLDYKFKHLKR